MERLCKFLHATEAEVIAMYDAPSLDAELLLNWSKLLKQNLFLYYHYHLVLHSQIGATTRVDKSKSPFPQNFYTQELRNYLVNLVLKEGMKALEVRQRYRIPKATFYKWLQTAKTPEIKNSDTTILEAKARVPMDYQLAFEDIAKERYGETIPKKITQKIQQLDSVKAVKECSDAIFEKKKKKKKKKRRQNYSEEFRKYVLQVQAQENLTNVELATRFNIGKATITKWKKQYNS